MLIEFKIYLGNFGLRVVLFVLYIFVNLCYDRICVVFEF